MVSSILAILRLGSYSLAESDLVRLIIELVITLDVLHKDTFITLLSYAEAAIVPRTARANMLTECHEI